MNGKLRLPIAAGIALAAASALGEEPSQKVYFDVDLGASIMPSVNIIGADRIDFNTGFSSAFRLGYQACQWAAFEANTGVIWNSVDEIGGVPVASYGGSMDLVQIPAMGNLVLSAPPMRGFRPYIGAGVGGVFGAVDFRNPLGDVKDDDFVFGYQAFAGVTYALSPKAELGIGYRFLQTRGHSWTDGGVTLDIEGTASHSIMLSFRWNF